MVTHQIISWYSTTVFWYYTAVVKIWLCLGKKHLGLGMFMSCHVYAIDNESNVSTNKAEVEMLQNLYVLSK